MLFQFATVALVVCAQHATALTVPSFSAAAQHLLSNIASTFQAVPSDFTMARKRVPGDSPAFYCNSTAVGDQLFEIDELTFAPNPPEA